MKPTHPVKASVRAAWAVRAPMDLQRFRLHGIAPSLESRPLRPTNSPACMATAAALAVSSSKRRPRIAVVVAASSSSSSSSPSHRRSSPRCRRRRRRDAVAPSESAAVVGPGRHRRRRPSAARRPARPRRRRRRLYPYFRAGFSPTTAFRGRHQHFPVVGLPSPCPPRPYLPPPSSLSSPLLSPRPVPGLFARRRHRRIVIVAI